MRKTATRSDALDTLVVALQSGVCDEVAARQLYTLGPDAVTLALLAAARRIAKQDAGLGERDARIAEQDARLALLEARANSADVSPATPFGMIPVYTKPNATTARGRRRKRPGARDGHPGQTAAAACGNIPGRADRLVLGTMTKAAHMHSYCDDRGHSLMSIYDHLSELPGQINVSTMYAGAVKAWHRHALQDDHWVVLVGNLKIGLFNTETLPITAELELAGPVPGAEKYVELEVAPGSGEAVHLGEHRPGVLRIPAGLWHGGVPTGGRDAVLLYYVTRKYDPQKPDEERKNWDALPFSWGVEFR